jgi:hypothetical protein
MNRLQSGLTALVFALSCACASTATDLPAGTPIGEAMAVDSVVQFAVVDASPADFFNHTVLVEAEVIRVCIKAGCWMQIEDEGSTALVRWETGCGGQFKFPEEAIGHRVLIQGSFYPKELTDADREHLSEEAGSPMEIRQDPYEFNASSVMILDAK